MSTELTITVNFFCIRCTSIIVVFLLDGYEKHVQMKFDRHRCFSFFPFSFFLFFPPEIRKEIAYIYKISDSLHTHRHAQIFFKFYNTYVTFRSSIFFLFISFPLTYLIHLWGGVTLPVCAEQTWSLICLSVCKEWKIEYIHRPDLIVSQPCSEICLYVRV